jgi:hypothetical protein
MSSARRPLSQIHVPIDEVGVPIRRYLGAGDVVAGAVGLPVLATGRVRGDEGIDLVRLEHLPGGVVVAQDLRRLAVDVLEL